MRKFDESKLVTELERLPIVFRVGFAAACAERQMSAYRLFEAASGGGGAPDSLEHALDHVWAEPTRTKSVAELEHQIEEVMALIPQEDGAQREWTQEATNAQNAGMSVVYALRTRLTGEAQEAAWAARVAYEALDNFVINKEAIDTSVPGGELRVVSHPLVQAELERQERDLRELLAASDGEVEKVLQQLRDRSRAESALFFGPVS